MTQKGRGLSKGVVLGCCCLSKGWGQGCGLYWVEPDGCGLNGQVRSGLRQGRGLTHGVEVVGVALR